MQLFLMVLGILNAFHVVLDFSNNEVDGYTVVAWFGLMVCLCGYLFIGGVFRDGSKTDN